MEVLQQEYYQPLIIPSSHFWWVVNNMIYTFVAFVFLFICIIDAKFFDFLIKFYQVSSLMPTILWGRPTSRN